MVQEKADMVIVLMNDQGYGVIKNIQDAQYGGRRCYADLHTPDYALLCASLRAAACAASAAWRSCAASSTRRWAARGPFLLEIDMLSIGGFKSTFAGPPTNTITQIPALAPKSRPLGHRAARCT